MSEMRILTVRQPWAWAIIHGGKDIENRVRNLAGDYRGAIAVHAGFAEFECEGGAYPEVARAIESEIVGYRVDDTYLWEVADDVEPEDPRFIYGSIIGVVDLTDVHDTSEEDHGATSDDPPAICSPWAEWGATRYHLVLANPRPLSTPIPFKGALGLRRLDTDTIRQIEGQLA